MPSLVSISDRHLSEDDVNQLNDVEEDSKTDPSDGPENDVFLGSTKTTAAKSSNNNGEELSSAELLTQETTEENEESSNDNNNNIATSSLLTSPPNKKRRVTPNDDSASKQDQQKKVNQMTLSSFFFQGGNNTKKSTTASTSTSTSTPPNKSTGKNKTSLSSKKHPRTDDDDDKVSPTIPKNEDCGSNNEKVEIEIIDLENDNDNDDQGNNREENKSMEKESKTNGENDQPTSEEEKGGNVDAEVKENAATAKVTQKVTSTTSITSFLSPSAVKKKKGAPTTPATTGKSSSNKRKTTTKTAATSSSARKSPKKSASTKKSKAALESSSSPTKVVVKTLSLDELPEERRTLLQSHNAMKARYVTRASELVIQYRNDGIEEEKDFNLGTVDLFQPVTDESELKLLNNNTAAAAAGETNCEEFPTQVLTNMGLLIEGSDLPLSDLVLKVCTELKAVHETTWSSDAVCAKIKLLSKRKAYFDAAQKSTTKVVDVFEDNDRDRLWRWEITTLDLLNTDFVSKARKARTARKKISSYQSALLRIVKSLEDAEKQIVNPALPKLDNVTAKISRDEEKVLKFERDAEKQRLADHVKAKKLLELETKRKAKEEVLEEKRLKKEEAAEKKKEETLAREEEKRKKEEEKDQKDEEKKMQEKKKLKQKSSFRSFFAAPKKVVTEQKKAAAVTTITDTTTNQAFDTDGFRSKINASNDVLTLALNQQKRTASAVACRKRRTKKIAVSVYQTVAPQEDDGWNAPSYLEQRTIRIPNKFRFLSFHENHRPAYHGTWSKKSSIVTGRNPFRKDASAFDYEDDSEGEWEEGDDEMGEDVEDDAKNQEEEEAEDADGNAKVYDFDDGFCVSDERLLDNEEDADEDTKALYKKKIEIQQNREREQHIHSNRISIIAPGPGGVPLYIADKECINTERVEGFETSDIVDILSSYQGMALSDDIKLSLDAFPQLHMNEEKRVETSTSTTEGNAANKDDYIVEDMMKMARFTHHSTLNSKDKLIDELRTAHPTVFSIRAKATRKLDAIAVKQRHPKYTSVCVYWEVKTEILTELGLTDILEKKVEDIVYENATPQKEKLVAPSAGNQESSKSKSSTGGKKRKPTTESTPDKTNSSKKKKNKNKTVKSDGKKVAGAKATTSTPKLVPKSNGKKDSPKKIKANKDASVGMKNLMAQFIKKSSPAKSATTITTSANTPKDTEASSSSQ